MNIEVIYTPLYQLYIIYLEGVASCYIGIISSKKRSQISGFAVNAFSRFQCILKCNRMPIAHVITLRKNRIAVIMSRKISFDEKFKTFRIYYGSSLYALCITPELSLEHLYWGKVRSDVLAEFCYYMSTLLLFAGTSCRVRFKISFSILSYDTVSHFGRKTKNWQWFVA